MGSMESMKSMEPMDSMESMESMEPLDLCSPAGSLGQGPVGFPIHLAHPRMFIDIVQKLEQFGLHSYGPIVHSSVSGRTWYWMRLDLIFFLSVFKRFGFDMNGPSLLGGVAFMRWDPSCRRVRTRAAYDTGSLWHKPVTPISLLVSPCFGYNDQANNRWLRIDGLADQWISSDWPAGANQLDYLNRWTMCNYVKPCVMACL